MSEAKMAVVDEWKPNTVVVMKLRRFTGVLMGPLADTIAVNRQTRDVSNVMLVMLLDQTLISLSSFSLQQRAPHQAGAQAAGRTAHRRSVAGIRRWRIHVSWPCVSRQSGCQ